jgi:hypothetical protein
MGKRRKSLLKLKVESSIQPKIIPISSPDGLPPYSRFFDTMDGVRFFLEQPRNAEEANRDHVPHIKTFAYAGEYSYSIKVESFFPKAEKILGSFAKCLARQVIHYTQIKSGSKSTLKSFNSALDNFVDFIETQEVKPSSFKHITQDTLISFGSYLIEENIAILNLTIIKRLFLENPEIDKKSIKSVSANNLVNLSSSEVGSFTEFENIHNEGYSEKELMQLLAYVYYELDIMLTSVSRIDRIKNEGLGANNLPYEIVKQSNDKVKSLFTSEPEGFEILIDNILLHNNSRTRISGLTTSSYINFLRIRALSLGLEDEYKQFSYYLRKDTWRLRAKILSGGEITDKELSYIKYLSQQNCTTTQFTLCIVFYVMLTTGINYSVLASWKRTINGKPWYENFDKFLGSDEDAPSRDRCVLMVGIKGKTGIAASKKIPTAIPINSPLFKYLKAYDKAHDPNREYFIVSNKGSDTLDYKLIKKFLAANPIYSDKGETFTTIKPKFFRKIFAGRKLLSLLGDVKSADELVYKLKEALNHSSFDTTLFSYIMKAGIGNQIMDSAIVALTSDLLEKSLKFSGQIKADHEKGKYSVSVFLCDCADPSKPTHGIPINNDHCRKYDMCLGCERSEVYAEHIPNICYRILQIEEMRENNGDIYNISMEDKHVIALDTLKKFEFKHSNGIDLLASGYAYANECFANNKPLLPPIIQMEKL